VSQTKNVIHYHQELEKTTSNCGNKRSTSHTE